MSTSKPHTIESIDTTDLASAVEELAAIVTQQSERIDQQSERIDQQSERIDQQSERIDQQSERIEELESELAEHQEETARERADDRQRLTDVEERLEAVEDSRQPHPTEGEDTDTDRSLTPIERLSQSDDVDEVTDSASVRRAVSLFENISDWGVKTPKGFCLRPADNPLSLLEADRDESLAWKQYYRAAQALERLSKGAVTFFDSDRHGKMLVLHEQSDVYERVSGSLSSSSAEAEV